jgi:hypothetical protein
LFGQLGLGSPLAKCLFGADGCLSEKPTPLPNQPGQLPTEPPLLLPDYAELATPLPPLSKLRLFRPQSLGHQVDQFHGIQMGGLEAKLIGQLANPIPKLFPLLLLLGVLPTGLLESLMDFGKSIGLALPAEGLGRGKFWRQAEQLQSFLPAMVGGLELLLALLQVGFGSLNFLPGRFTAIVQRSELFQEGQFPLEGVDALGPRSAARRDGGVQSLTFLLQLGRLALEHLPLLGAGLEVAAAMLLEQQVSQHCAGTQHHTQTCSQKVPGAEAQPRQDSPPTDQPNSHQQ